MNNVEYIRKYAEKYNINPYILQAIHMHDTREGITTQLDVVARWLDEWNVRPGRVTQAQIQHFELEPGWAQSVFNIYSHLIAQDAISAAYTGRRSEVTFPEAMPGMPPEDPMPWYGRIMHFTALLVLAILGYFALMKVFK